MRDKVVRLHPKAFQDRLAAKQLADAKAFCKKEEADFFIDVINKHFGFDFIQECWRADARKSVYRDWHTAEELRLELTFDDPNLHTCDRPRDCQPWPLVERCRTSWGNFDIYDVPGEDCQYFVSHRTDHCLVIFIEPDR